MAPGTESLSAMISARSVLGGARGVVMGERETVRIDNAQSGAASGPLDPAKSEIELLGLDDSGIEGRKGFGHADPDVLTGRVRLDRLADNISDFCRQAGQLFATASAASSGLHLESMELSLALTAKGEVRLVGAVSGEVSGGITLVFKRRTGD